MGFSQRRLDEFFGHVISGILEETDKRIKAQSRDSFKGVWQSALTYKRGDYVSVNGSLFHCNVDGARSRPGTDNDWQLAVKHGQDLRDAPPPPPPPRVPTRHERRQPP
jgi:hypothetical protein